MHKKSQMKMIESIFVIIIFMIILMIVVVFFARFQRTETQFASLERSLRESVELVQTVASLPEVSCSQGASILETCVDLIKLEILDELSSSERLYYFDIFRYATIVVRQFFPDSDEDLSWVVYNLTKPDSSFFTTAIPVGLYDSDGRRTYFGIMEVTYYD